MSLASDFNHARFDPLAVTGFYESYFQRANHPTRPLAFWIRYTLFAPRGRPQDAIGELWAVWSDGERGQVVSAKSEVSAALFSFARDRFEARVGESVLKPGELLGYAAGAVPGPGSTATHRVGWNLRYEGGQRPLWLLPEALYGTRLPKAKSLVGVPMARYEGSITVDGETHAIEGWIGSQNHNWGTQHTDRYAYGQVCGFDNATDSFLELATAQVRLGPFHSPRMTPIVLRHEGVEYALRGVGQSLLARAGYETGDAPVYAWRFRSSGPGVTIDGVIEAPRDRFVALTYYNPPGGAKLCLNSKLASCRLALRRDGSPEKVLTTSHRAAFEVLA